MCPPEPAIAHDVHDTPLPRGCAIGRFVVQALVGRGGMGSVYAAYDPDLDRTVAIKLLRAGRGSNSAEGRLRLMREAQAIARVSHPNVVVVYDTGTFEDRVFIAMELVDGHTLGYWMQARSRTWPEVLEVFAAAGRGLAAAHDRDLVHRDFKPDNVMIAVDGQVRVMDFGLVRRASDRSHVAHVAHGSQAPFDRTPAPREAFARAARDRDGDGDGDGDGEEVTSTRVIGASAAFLRPDALGDSVGALDTNLTSAGTIVGTPAYMSPEQYEGALTDARSDQFSFCVALHEAIYGERPFAGRNPIEIGKAVLAGRIRDPPAEVAAKVPPWIREVLLRGLRVDPERRWPSMNALLAELEKQPAAAARRRFVAAAAEKLAGTWEVPTGVDTPAKAEVRRAFLSTGKLYAAKAFDGASQILDRYARRWSELYVEACEATHVRAEQSAEVLDLRMACLTEGLANLGALCAMFRQATPEVVENAVTAASALGGLDRCADVELLRAVVRPPDDPVARATVERLRTGLAEARAFGRVGRLNAGLDAIGPLEAEARAAGYQPLLADVLLARGTLHAFAGSDAAAGGVFEEAVWTALASRHDEAAIEATTHLVYVTGVSQGRFEAGELWSRLGETLLQRIGGHDLFRGWLLNNRGAMREMEGRLPEALEDSRQAAAVKQRTLGPDHPDVGYSIGNAGIVLDQLGDLDGAVEHLGRALDIVRNGLGPDHPNTARVQSNYSECLARAGRFDEADVAAAQALAVFEREADPAGLHATYPLLVLGICRAATGRLPEALPMLERAHRTREELETAPARRAEAAFALARALWDAGQADGQSRARALATRAAEEYGQSPATPATTRELAAIESWLARAST